MSNLGFSESTLKNESYISMSSFDRAFLDFKPTEKKKQYCFNSL